MQPPWPHDSTTSINPYPCSHKAASLELQVSRPPRSHREMRTYHESPAVGKLGVSVLPEDLAAPPITVYRSELHQYIPNIIRWKQSPERRRITRQNRTETNLTPPMLIYGSSPDENSRAVHRSCWQDSGTCIPPFFVYLSAHRARATPIYR